MHASPSLPLSSVDHITGSQSSICSSPPPPPLSRGEADDWEAQQATRASLDKLNRLAELQRDIALLKDVLQRTRTIRVLLDGFDRHLAHEYGPAQARVRDQLAGLLFLREELLDQQP